MTVAIDSQANPARWSSGGSISSDPLTTTGSGDLVYVFVGAEGTGSYPAVTGVTGGGLIFTERAVVNNTTNTVYGFQCSSLYVAEAASPLTAISFTATCSPVFDDAVIFAFAVKSTISAVLSYDAVAATSQGTNPYRVTLDSGEAEGMALVFCGSTGNEPITPVGLTVGQSHHNSGGVNGEGAAWAYTNFTSALSADSVGWTDAYDRSAIIGEIIHEPAASTVVAAVAAGARAHSPAPTVLGDLTVSATAAGARAFAGIPVVTVTVPPAVHTQHIGSIPIA